MTEKGNGEIRNSQPKTRNAKQKLFDAPWVKRIQDLMREKYLKDYEMAEKTGIPRQQFNAYKLGSTKPQLEALIKIADALDVSTDYLLGRTDSKQPIGEDKESIIKSEFVNYYEVITVINRLEKALGSEIICNSETCEPEIGPQITLKIADSVIVNYYLTRAERLKSMEQYSKDPVLLSAINQANIKLLYDLTKVPFSEPDA